MADMSLVESSSYPGNDVNRNVDVRGSGRRKILVISSPFPSSVDPSRGVFVKNRVKAVAELGEFDVRVIAPIPWFPPLRMFPRWYRWSQYPREEIFEGLKVYHPRYLLPPKIGGYVHPRLMYPAVRRVARQLRNEGFAFDLIDTHFVFPNGVVGALLAKEFNVPFIMTGRGEDMLRFPGMPFKGKRIRWAIGQADHCIALSREISSAFIECGAIPEKVSLIPNGVDTTRFQPQPRDECRRTLDLSTDAKIILAVGDRLELKGYHLLVDALPQILKSHPEAYLVIVGGPGRFGRDYTDVIQNGINQHGLQKNVLLAGPQPHSSLPAWYNAADLFAIPSSREGSPNVLLEALACGTPAIGTDVGGIADELSQPHIGSVIPQRTVPSIAKTINAALSQPWDRNRIRATMETRSWANIAATVTGHFTP